MTPAHYAVSGEDAGTVVVLAGEIDIATTPQLRRDLAAAVALGRDVIVDLSQVNFLDASGLGVLAGTCHRARAAGVTLHLVGPPPRVYRLFRLTGLDRHLPIAATREEVPRSPGGRRTAGPALSRTA